MCSSDLDFKPVATTNAWTQLTGPAATNEFTDVGGAVQTQRLYRVRHVP